MSMKVDVDPNRFFPETMERMTADGLLLATVAADGKPNVMTISWGMLGAIWNKPVFLAMVRPSRLSYRNIEETGAFTVNVPATDMSDRIAFCGSRSGRTCDKFAQCGLTAAAAKAVDAPIVGECAIHYECRVVHKNDVQPPCLADDIRGTAYADGNYHRIYWGEILACRADIDEEDRVLGPLG